MVELLLNGGWNFETERLCRHHPFHHTSQRAGLRCTNGIPHTENRQLQLAILFMFYLSHVLVYQCSACSQKSNAMTSSCSHSSRFQDSFCVFVPFFYCLLISVDFLLSGIAAAKAPKEVPETTSMGIPNSCIAWITPKCTLPRAPPPPKQTPTAFPASSRATLPTSADICRHLPTSADLSVRCHWTCNFFRLSPNILWQIHWQKHKMSVSFNLNSLLFTSEKPDCSQGMLGCFRPGPIPSIFWAEPYMMPAPSDKVHSLNKTKKMKKLIQSHRILTW